MSNATDLYMDPWPHHEQQLEPPIEPWPRDPRAPKQPPERPIQVVDNQRLPRTGTAVKRKLKLKKEIGRAGIGAYLVSQVKKYGGEAEKHTSPGHRGVPDYLVSWPRFRVTEILHDNFTLSRAAEQVDGVMHLVETKSPTGKLRGEQTRDHKRRMDRFKIPVYVLNNVERVDAYVRDCAVAVTR